ncbi:hypothetical protein CFIMG_000010RA [Ceratocystis fimbriata CBS 114723]|uniref:Uncharacterized protein n=1 Tax=Ceratocystis fimbriata CBS 114723 TaxID=1035309 RepID=A0A2C5XGL2_9PEZI|nr:hypothetical protein CFIMG_000010RA [Ceratocystis fimbriata CBS 114723]
MSAWTISYNLGSPVFEPSTHGPRKA